MEDVVRGRLWAEENRGDDDITRYDAPHCAANDSHRVSAATLPNTTFTLNQRYEYDVVQRTPGTVRASN